MVSGTTFTASSTWAFEINQLSRKATQKRAKLMFFLDQSVHMVIKRVRIDVDVDVIHLNLNLCWQIPPPPSTPDKCTNQVGDWGRWMGGRQIGFSVHGLTD
jgi:hypothetical protein